MLSPWSFSLRRRAKVRLTSNGGVDMARLHDPARGGVHDSDQLQCFSMTLPLFVKTRRTGLLLLDRASATALSMDDIHQASRAEIFDSGFLPLRSSLQSACRCRISIEDQVRAKKRSNCSSGEWSRHKYSNLQIRSQCFSPTKVSIYPTCAAYRITRIHIAVDMG